MKQDVARVSYALEDALLAAVPVACLALRPAAALPWALAAGAALALAWNVCTLHFPREALADARGVRFRAYGREHAFLFEEHTVSVRRFLVRDRVLVRLRARPGAEPVPPTRGRYWLRDSLAGYESLVASLEARAAQDRLG